MQDEVVALLRAKDQGEFERFTQKQRKALILYCYRMLGSLSDAEDIAQETFWRAWQRLGSFEGRSSLRTWLYQIATYACLDLLKKRRRTLPSELHPPARPDAPLLPAEAEAWLDPLPASFLLQEEIGPEARYTQKESVALAFLVALQLLPPKQRASVLLCDVLGWRVEEVAALLETTPSSVSSALHRGRTTLREKTPEEVSLSDEKERLLLARYVEAWESGDLAAFASLLREDTVVTMPPTPSWYLGRDAIVAFYRPVFLLSQGGVPRYRFLPVVANEQSAFAVYRYDPEARCYLPFAIKLCRIRLGALSRIDIFASPLLFPRFALPAQLPPSLEAKG